MFAGASSQILASSYREGKGNLRGGFGVRQQQSGYADRYNSS